jgi:undecaprenyl-diphosphatase
MNPSIKQRLDRHVIISATVVLGALLAFAGITRIVLAHEALAVLDRTLVLWLRAHASAVLTDAMLLVTHWHSTIGIGVMGLLLARFLYVRRATFWLWIALVAVPGGMLLNVLLKYTFERARPVEYALLHLPTYSFPSGHAVNATVFYGVLAGSLLCSVRHWPTRSLVLVLAAGMVVLVALSRVYLGVHYLGDVLAGIAEGVAWLGACITGGLLMRRRPLNAQHGA